MDPSKQIFISYDEKDTEIAILLSSILDEWFNTKCTFLRSLDSDGGSFILDEIGQAIQTTKWFIVLISKNSINSVWLTQDASIQTMRSIEEADYKVITVMLDSSQFPAHLEIYFKNRYIHHAKEKAKREEAFYELGEYIEGASPELRMDISFVNRGADIDKFWEDARKKKIVFIWGWAGIGKTAFVQKKVKEKLKKLPKTISLTLGYTLDRLCREIISEMGEYSTFSNLRLTDSELLKSAISSIKKNKDRFFLFIDNAEYGLDTGNELLKYLDVFLKNFADEDIDTHIILSTTRNPDISSSIIRESQIFQLGLLEDSHIEEILENLLSSNDYARDFIKSQSYPSLVKMIDGYPLAAHFVAIAAKTRTLHDLTSDYESKKIRLKAARSILSQLDEKALKENHRLILQVLTVVNAPMTMQDMRAIRKLNSIKLVEMQKIKAELIDYGLIHIRTDESLQDYHSIHTFLQDFYWDQLVSERDLIDSIANQYGTYAYNKAIEIFEILKTHYENKDISTLDMNNLDRLLISAIRYNNSANKLLRMINLDSKADKLPKEFYSIGIFRELVTYFYQERKDYEKALKYAEAWLELNPSDAYIRLFQIRCYRNFRTADSLNKAENLVSLLETKYSKRKPRTEILREKALIADFKGEEEKAIKFFQEGISIDRNSVYPGNYTGLAMILLRQAERLPEGSPKRIEKSQEALELLEEARDGNNQSSRDRFDEFHLATYVEALIENGKAEIALPLLASALEKRPNDPRLLFRMAEIYRSQEDYELAQINAMKARQAGEEKASITLSNILFIKGMKSNGSDRNNYLNEALNMANSFEPEYGSGHEVKATTRSKILRALKRFDEALEVFEILPKGQQGFYSYLEQIKIWQDKCQQAEEKQDFLAALSCINEALEISHRTTGTHLLNFETQVDELLDTERRIRSYLR